jgi:hypothetical protein
MVLGQPIVTSDIKRYIICERLLRQLQWGVRKRHAANSLKGIYGKNMKAADATEKGQPVWISKISHEVHVRTTSSIV